MYKNLQPKLALLIPCYNERQRLKIESFQKFISENGTYIDFFFIDDGSHDETASFLSNHLEVYQNFYLIRNKNNLGKGNALLKAVLEIDFKDYTYFGFIDADLDIPLEQVLKLYTSLDQSDYLIAISNREFYRSFNFLRLRSYISLMMTGMANLLLKFDPPIKDTQCGCKLFRTEVNDLCFKEPFVSDWLFDIEVFLRFKKNYTQARNLIIEVPTLLNKNKSNSALKILSAHRILFQLFKITRIYK